MSNHEERATPETGGPEDPSEARLIEVADQPGLRPDAQEPGAQGASPYRNLLVPLVVVPALIVMVFVLVLAFFGTITGAEASPEENVERLLNGGANERTQAAFNLVRQTLQDWEAELAGEERVWEMDETLLPKLKRAWEETSDIESEGDVAIPLALATLLAQLGDEDGAAHLAAITRLPAELDPEGEYRLFAGFSLGVAGPRLDGPGQAVARQALADLIESEDLGLRIVGAVSLQTLPGPETTAILTGLLTDRSLEVRANAALSLASLGSPAGRAVLEEMLAQETYREEQERLSTKWGQGRLVSESRRKALAALASIDALPGQEELERLAEEDPDAEVRSLARTLLQGARGEAAAASVPGG